jgi:hypothetical protein
MLTAVLKKLFGLPGPIPNPPYWEAILAVLNKAFPNGITEEEYWSLFHILGEHFGRRNLVDILYAVSKKELGFIMNDSLHAERIGDIDGNQLLAIRGRLVS